jgi:hypothetical protein
MDMGTQKGGTMKIKKRALEELYTPNEDVLKTLIRKG